jgi:hypothetical protein
MVDAVSLREVVCTSSGIQSLTRRCRRAQPANPGRYKCIRQWRLVLGAADKPNGAGHKTNDRQPNPD